MQAQEEHNVSKSVVSVRPTRVQPYFLALCYYDLLSLECKKRALQCSLNEALAGSAHM